MNNTNWQTTIPYSTKVTITQRLATTVYDRTNLTIIDIFELSTPTPTSYAPSDFFPIFGLALDFDTRALDNIHYTAFQYLEYLTTFVQEQLALSRNAGFEGTLALRQLMATPVLVFNNQFIEQNTDHSLPSENLNRTATLVVPGYQVRDILLGADNLVGHFTNFILGVCCWGRAFTGLVHDLAFYLHESTSRKLIVIPRNGFCFEMYCANTGAPRGRYCNHGRSPLSS